MGGVAFLKHPVGMEFHRFFGENLLRSDLGISTSPLGSWLDHIGPPGESERNAARIFGADWTFYVLGGSSTSNQIVGHGVIAQDDIVLADANCHKSICHSLTVTGARPVYFKPTRNGYGMIGLVPLKRFSPEYIQRADRQKSLSAQGVRQPEPHLCGRHELDLRRPLLRRQQGRYRSWRKVRAARPLRRGLVRLRQVPRRSIAGRFAMGVPDDMPDRPHALRRAVHAQDAGGVLHGAR